MRAWLADYFRSLGAPWYWNARKSVFALRGDGVLAEPGALCAERVSAARAQLGGELALQRGAGERSPLLAASAQGLRLAGFGRRDFGGRRSVGHDAGGGLRRVLATS